MDDAPDVEHDLERAEAERLAAMSPTEMNTFYAEQIMSGSDELFAATDSECLAVAVIAIGTNGMLGMMLVGAACEHVLARIADAATRFDELVEAEPPEPSPVH